MGKFTLRCCIRKSFLESLLGKPITNSVILPPNCPLALKKRKQILFISLPWLLLGPLFVYLYQPDLQVWPNQFPHRAYSDSMFHDHGNSSIYPLSSSTTVLKYAYVLGKKFQFPYASLSFEHKTNDTLFDLSGYDYVHIAIESEKGKRIPVVLNQDIPGYSRPEDGLSYRVLVQELEYKKGQRDYFLPLSGFTTPSWWFANRKLTESDLSAIDLTRILNIQLHNCQLLPVGTKEVFSVYGVCFKKNYQPWYISALACLLLYYATYTYYTSRTTAFPKSFPRQELNIGNVSDEEKQKVLQYMATSYSNSELALELAQKELGLSENKISAAVKDASGMSFKRYLNHIRMEETKRLLLQTDRQVMDIAFKVGYANISHFNRVFKEAEGCSPNEYRKKGPSKA